MVAHNLASVSGLCDDRHTLTFTRNDYTVKKPEIFVRICMRIEDGALLHCNPVFVQSSPCPIKSRRRVVPMDGEIRSR